MKSLCDTFILFLQLVITPKLHLKVILQNIKFQNIERIF